MNNLKQLANLQPNQCWILNKNGIHCCDKKSWLGRSFLWLKGETLELDKIFYALADQIKNCENLDLISLRQIEKKSLLLGKKEPLTPKIKRAQTALLRASNDLKEKNLRLGFSLHSLQGYSPDYDWEIRRRKLFAEIGDIPAPKILPWLAQQGSIEAMESLLQTDPSYSTKIKEDIKKLLSQGWNIDSRNEKGESLLHILVKSEHSSPELIEFLLENGTDIHSIDNQKRNALHWALDRSHPSLEVVKILVEHKVLLNSRDIRLDCPLHIITKANHPSFDILKLLIDNGAKIQSYDRQCRTPHFYAVTNPTIDPEIPKYFETLRPIDWSPLHALVVDPLCTPEKIVELVEQGVNINSVDYFGYTPLHWAAASESTRPEIIAALIKCGADVLKKDHFDESPVFLSVANLKPNLDVIKIFFEHGVDVNTDNLVNNAAANPNVDVMKLVISQGVDLKAKSLSENTPLADAAINPNSDVIQLLLQHEPSLLKTLKKNGQYILRVACQNPNTEMIDFVLSQGVDINERYNGINTIDWAGRVYRNPDIIRILIRHGAKVNAQDKDGNTPLDNILSEFTPSSKPNENVLEILLRHGADSHELPGVKSVSTLTGTFQEKVMLKTLANSWSVPGRSTIRQTENSSRLELNRAGFRLNDGQKELLRLLRIFSSKNKGLLGLYRMINDSYAKGDTLTHGINRFSSGEPMSFMFGWGGGKQAWWKRWPFFKATRRRSAHGIAINFYGDYAIINNRGEGRYAMSSAFCKINRKDNPLTTKVLSQLTQNDCEPSTRKGKNFVYNDLLWALGYSHKKQDKIAHFLNTKIEQKNQKMGNCWWVSAKASFLALMVIDEITKTLGEKMNKPPLKYLDFSIFKYLSEDIEDQKALEQAYERARALYKKFSAFCRLQILKEYLERPRDAVSRDHDLVKAVAEKLKKERWKKYFESTDCLFKKEEVYGWIQDYQNKYFLDKNFKTIWQTNLPISGITKPYIN